MIQQSTEYQPESQAFELVSQALLAEYGAIRDAPLARESIVGSLENFMMVVVSAAIVTLPTLIKDQQFLLLPIVALILSTIALARHHQAYVHGDLSSYESEVLQPRLVGLIRQIDPSAQLSDTVAGLWQWQSYFRKKQLQGRLPGRLTRIWTTHGLEPLFVLTCLGFLLLFLYYRGTVNWTVPEMISFILAAVFSVWITLLFAWSIAGTLISIVKK